MDDIRMTDIHVYTELYHSKVKGPTPSPSRLCRWLRFRPIAFTLPRGLLCPKFLFTLAAIFEQKDRPLMVQSPLEAALAWVALLVYQWQRDGQESTGVLQYTSGWLLIPQWPRHGVRGEIGGIGNIIKIAWMIYFTMYLPKVHVTPSSTGRRFWLSRDVCIWNANR